MTESTVRIIPQGEILKGSPEPPQLLLPDAAAFFSDRAARFRALADAGHPDAAFFGLLERVSRAQQAALDAHPEPIAPDASHMELCRQHGLPPLGKDNARHQAWRASLQAIVKNMGADVPEPVLRIVWALESAGSETLETMADRVLGLDYPELDPVAVPFVAAALQVHWVKRAIALGEAAFARLDVANICPVCGSPPVAGVLKAAPVPGVRYLHCALCGTDWQLPRGQCSQCDTREKVAYFHVESGTGSVKAEACDECRGYLKIVNMEKEPRADPVADDLATLALDILMDESGYQRVSPNYFFVPGQT